MTLKAFGHLDKPSDMDAAGGRWIDLKAPDQREIDEACRTTGLRIPTRDELEEIETSSRTYISGGAIYVSLPMLTKAAPGNAATTPLGFVLTRNTLVTTRFDELASFDQVQELLGDVSNPPSIFVRIVDSIVDRLADVEEHAEEALDKISHEIFAHDRTDRRPSRATANMRALLQRIGHLSNLISIIRNCLLGMSRMIPFVQTHAAEWLPHECSDRLTVAKQDVASLIEFETHLTDKTQFLLDATLGFVGIAQNDLFRILTIASVVGIPPTVMVGIWGMNFKQMPELDWSFGYPIALIIIVLSAIIPAIWFKLRGWL
jgi:magnesium transporter